MSGMEKIQLAALTVVVAATAPCMVYDASSAQAVSADRQNAQSAPDFQMPAGDFRSAADAAAVAGQVIERRSPTPAAELTILKNLKDDTNQASVVVDADSAAGPVPQAVLTNCSMQSSSGFAPSDVHGAVTPTNLIEVTNVDIQVRNKTNCALVSAVSLKTFFNGFTIPAAETLFDPRVLFDRPSNRCIVTVESRNSGNTDQFLYIASSRNSSCTSWRRICSS